jgi:integrase
VDFVLADGDARKLQKIAEAPPRPTAALTLESLRDQYLATHRGAQEENSLSTVRMHFGHFIESMGARFHVREMTTQKLQEHIDRRKGKKALSPVTLKKEVATLRAAWNWAAHTGRLSGPFPGRGLVYPKQAEKPPFQTFAEIEKKVAGGMPEAEAQELWESLYLTQPEIAELLEYVKAKAEHGWIYPAVSFAAHTGARRSEVLRVRVHDLDLSGKTVLIHEKKRARGRRTTRRVPLSPFLVGVLKDGLADHPGGPYLFCHAGEVFRSKKRSQTTGHQSEKVRPSSLKGRMATVRKRELPAPGALTRDEAHDHLGVPHEKWTGS